MRRLEPGDAAWHVDEPVRVISLRSYAHLDIRGQVRRIDAALVTRHDESCRWIDLDELVPLAQEVPTFASVDEADAWLEARARLYDGVVPVLPPRLQDEPVNCDQCGCCTYVLDAVRSTAISLAPVVRVRYSHLPLGVGRDCTCLQRDCACTRQAVAP